MKKVYSPAQYEVTLFELNADGIVTLSSDRENAYVGPTDGIWNDFDFDDDDD